MDTLLMSLSENAEEPRRIHTKLFSVIENNRRVLRNDPVHKYQALTHKDRGLGGTLSEEC